VIPAGAGQRGGAAKHEAGGAKALHKLAAGEIT
jgi:hypothetical protein